MIKIFRITKGKKFLIFLSLLIILTIISGGIHFYFNYDPKKEFTIDKQAKINPNKKYKIVYWDYPLLWGESGDYKTFLQDKIDIFQQTYPNIEIEYKFLSPLEGEIKLKQRLEAGTPPDIYNSIFADKRFNSKLQIPISLLISDEDLKKYHPAAIESFSKENKIWGLPQWLFPQVWVANESILKKADLDLTTIYQHGWNWSLFRKTAQDLSSLEHKKHIIFHPYNEKLLFQLLAANKGAKIISEKKEFNKERIIESFELLAELREDTVFPAPEEKMGKKLLPYFWQGKAGIIAPVTPWLLNSIYQQHKRYSNISLTLLPVPVSDNMQGKFLVETTGLVLFRQQEYQGDDHSKAVYKFAQFINQKQNFYLSKKLKVLPAYLPSYSNWKREVKLNNKIKDLLLNYAQSEDNINSLSIQNGSLIPEIKGILGTEYQKFWLNDLSTVELVNEIEEKIARENYQ